MNYESRRAHRSLVHFPRIPGLVQSIVPLSKCAYCDTKTIVAFDGDPTCLEHALWLRKMVSQRKNVVKVLEKLREEI